jgi:hypothetical protein
MLPEVVTVEHIVEWLESLPPKTVVQEYDGITTQPSNSCVVTTYAKEKDVRVTFSTRHAIDKDDEVLALIDPKLGYIMTYGFDAASELKYGRLGSRLEAHEALSIIDGFIHA